MVMKNLVLKFVGHFFFIVALMTIPSVCIAQELTKAELEKRSMTYFNEGNYTEAIAGFEKLYANYSKEVNYTYYLGRCYLDNNINYDKCIELLSFAASKNYTSDVHFYLFLTFYRNYRFSEAEISLLNFRNLSGKKQRKEFHIDFWQKALEIAKMETFKIADITTKSKEEITYEHIGRVCTVYLKGNLISKPNELMLSDDKKKDYKGTMFMPGKTNTEDLLYFAGISKNNKTKKDLFFVSKITDKEFSLPEPIIALNTRDNEEYPYFDKNSRTLYFSSDKLGGLGGYDIYKSVFNDALKSFNIPERMEFPINTPFDDFLYIPDSIGKTAVFLSNRSTSGNFVTAYKVIIENKSTYLFPKTSEEIAQISSLPVKAEKVDVHADIENLSPDSTSIVLSEYDLILKEALGKQLLCDSMNSLIISKKNRLSIEADANNRKIIFSEIKSLEKELALKRKETDKMFSRAQELRGESKPLQPETIENYVDTEAVYIDQKVGDLNIYVYKTERSDNTSQQQAWEYDKTKISPFEILITSPYSIENPIPINEKIPDQLLYRIQLGAYSQIMPIETFGGLFPLAVEQIEGNEMVKYFVGYFATSKAAREALDKVKNYGFKDAFVVPYYEQKKISIQNAREIEFGQKKW